MLPSESSQRDRPSERSNQLLALRGSPSHSYHLFDDLDLLRRMIGDGR